MITYILLSVLILLLAIVSEQIAVGLSVVLGRSLKETLWLVIPGANLGIFFYFYFPEELRAIKKMISRQTKERKEGRTRLWVIKKITWLNKPGWKILAIIFGFVMIIVPTPVPFTYVLGIATFRILKLRFGMIFIFIALNARVIFTAKGLMHISPWVNELLKALGF